MSNAATNDIPRWHRAPNTNSWYLGPPLGGSWNNRLNVDPLNDATIRKLPLNPWNGSKNINKDSAVTPLDMYLGLLYPSCPVGIETKTRKKLHQYATSMRLGHKIAKTERERMEKLLKRLVDVGPRCGFAWKNPGKTYRLPTKQEMMNLGHVAWGESGKFFYKRPRKPDPTPNPRKGPKRPKENTGPAYPLDQPSPGERRSRRVLAELGYDPYMPRNQIGRVMNIALAKRFVQSELQKMGLPVDLTNVPEDVVYMMRAKILLGDYNSVFAQLASNTSQINRTPHSTR